MNDDDPKGHRFWFGLLVGVIFVIPMWMLFIWWFWT
jgi:cytoskeletal protein RodZ